MHGDAKLPDLFRTFVDCPASVYDRRRGLLAAVAVTIA
jgi:hypothetical protein